MALQTSWKLLLIDDQPSFSRGLAQLLRRDGYTIDTMDNGQHALARLSTQRYDLILCDLHMPVLDGPAFYTMLQQQFPALCSRIIFLTGDALGSDSTAWLTRCGQPCLYKPFTAAEVRRVIHQVLDAAGSNGSASADSVDRDTEASTLEDGTLSVMRRGEYYQVRYASNHPYADECSPWMCPDEDMLRALLFCVGIGTEAQQHACAVARQGGVAVLPLRVSPEQVQSCFRLTEVTDALR